MGAAGFTVGSFLMARGTSPPDTSVTVPAAHEPLRMVSCESRPLDKKTSTGIVADIFSHNPGKPRIAVSKWLI